MTVIVDYGVGNLFSLQCSFRKIGEEVLISSDAEDLVRADRILLPGVGAFGDAADKLRQSGLVPALKKQAAEGKPILGICLGMQLLFGCSYEFGVHEGLSLLRGRVIPIPAAGLKIPHMGWNALHFKGEKHPLFRYLNDGEYVYFVHSYCAADCENSVIAVCDYGGEITAAAAAGNVMGCQFHPEKSGETGLKILKAFCEMRGGCL